MVRSSYGEGNKTVDLCHYAPGPILSVQCCQFLPTEPFQTRILRKDSSGWHWVGTTAYCLAEKINLSPYIRECVTNALEEACSRTGPAAFFFQMAKDFRSVSSYNLSPGTCFWLLVNVRRINSCESANASSP